MVGRYGWSDADDGFVLGSAWRVLNGEVPYRDFIDVRPPTSAYLHAIWPALIASRYVFAAARMGALTQMWVYSCVACVALTPKTGEQGRPWRKVYLLAVAGFLASAMSFTPMPWHTTDGIFFCGVGAGVLVLRRGGLVAALVGVLVALGMGAKQSFYPVAPMALLYLASQRRWRDAGMFCAAMALVVGSFVIWLQAQGALGDFVAQTSARTDAAAVFEAGGLTYARLGLPWLLRVGCVALGCGAVIWTTRASPPTPLGVRIKAAARLWAPTLTVLLVGAMILIDYWTRIGEGAWVNASTLGYPHALFAAGALSAIVRCVRPERGRGEGGAQLLLLGVAWCASLSIGFPTPILFMAPILAGLAHPGLSDESGTGPGLTKFALGPSLATAGVASVLAGSAALWPYEDLDGRARATCLLETAEPRLALIVSGPQTCRKLQEYKRLRRSFSGPFITLPAFATSHMLEGVLNPIASDWPTVAEDAGQSRRLIREVDARVADVFIDRRQAAAAEGDQVQPIARHVEKSWRRVAVGDAYTVYERRADPAR